MQNGSSCPMVGYVPAPYRQATVALHLILTSWPLGSVSDIAPSGTSSQYPKIKVPRYLLLVASFMVIRSPSMSFQAYTASKNFQEPEGDAVIRTGL